jgi:DNA-binding NarL/FixJ family response regulator
MKERATKKIVIVDDNELYRQSLKRLLVDFDIIGEAENGAEVLPLIQTTNPDLLILDLSIPRISGILIARHLKESYPHLRILVLSIHDSEEHIQGAIHAGVNGYCLKDEKRTDILFAVNTVLNGVYYFSPMIMNKVENAFKN